MATPRPDSYTAPAGQTLYAGRTASVSAPAAEFVGAPLTGTLPLTTTFTDQSTGQITGRLWNFGDGTTSTSTNPSKVWTTVGPHTVSLTVNGPGGSNTRTRANYVTGIPATAPPPPPPPPVGTVLTTLQAVEDTGQAIQAYYEATVLPLRGAVPAGTTLQSPDDGTLRAAVLSTWDDGSAAVVVVGGTTALAANQSKALRLQAGAPVVEPAMTVARIAANAVTASVAFVGGISATVAFDASAPPTRVWWATSRNLCASWTVPVPGAPGLALVWVAHGWQDTVRTFVEVTCENSLVNMASPADFTPVAYIATVIIGGALVATVNTDDSPEDTHSGTRAWYASGWVNLGRTVRVTQAHADLQRHPLLFRIPEAPTWNRALYASDAYTPWGNGRIVASNMGGGGDHPGIGPLPQWDCRALQSGYHEAWRAVEAAALSALSYNINTRDASTGLVPTLAAIGTRFQGSGWPRLVPAGSGGGALGWEVAHCPDVGLMAFVGRPSPVFIELAQKAAVWCGTVYGGSSAPISWQAGVAGGFYQTRGKAWAIRAIAHATMLTPDALPWKATGAVAIERNVALLEGFKDDARNVLGYVWYLSPSAAGDFNAAPGFQHPMWMHHFLASVLHRAERAVGHLLGGSASRFADLADWACAQPARFINEAAGGEWRYIPYIDTVGNRNITLENGIALGSGIYSLNAMEQEPTWGEQRAAFFAGPVPPLAGPWKTHSGVPQNYTTGWVDDSVGGFYYVEPFVDVLGCAVERGVPGALPAYEKMLANVEGFATWRAGFGSDPRFGGVPRNYTSSGWGEGADVGTYNPTTRLWTPGRDGAGIINAASVAALPFAEWVLLDGSRIDLLDAEVKAALPGWQDRGSGNWYNVFDNYCGFGYDMRAGHETQWIIFSGGHFGGANTGVYSRDVRRGRWNIELLPIPDGDLFPQWTLSGLINAGLTSFTQYNPAWFYYIGNEANPEGVYYDEHFDPAQSDPRFSTRRPMPRHSYGSQIVVPKPDGSVDVISHCRRFWRYNSLTRQFAQPIFAFGNQTEYTGARGYAGENMDAWWSETEQRYYVNGTQDFGDSQTISCLADGTNWRYEGSFPTGGYQNYYKAVEQQGGTLYTLLYNSGNGGNQPGRPYRMRISSIAAKTSTNHDITLGASFAGKTFASDDASGYWDGGCVTFVTPLNRFFCNVRTVQDGEVLAVINRDTWVMELATFPGQPSASMTLLENKMRYWPTLGVVTLDFIADQNTRLMRVT